LVGSLQGFQKKIQCADPFRTAVFHDLVDAQAVGRGDETDNDDGTDTSKRALGDPSWLLLEFVFRPAEMPDTHDQPLTMADIISTLHTDLQRRRRCVLFLLLLLLLLLLSLLRATSITQYLRTILNEHLFHDPAPQLRAKLAQFLISGECSTLPYHVLISEEYVVFPREGDAAWRWNYCSFLDNFPAALVGLVSSLAPCA
jgi:hypothetical protein